MPLGVPSQTHATAAIRALPCRLLPAHQLPPLPVLEPAWIPSIRWRPLHDQERLACLVAHHSGARLEVEERGLVDELADIRGREADGLVVGSSTSWLLLAVGAPLLAEGRNPAG
jgi:hypothetical protein